VSVIASPAEVRKGRAGAVTRRERPPTVPDLVVAHFVRGEGIAAELTARLAVNSDYSLAQLYEALRLGVYHHAEAGNQAEALRLCVLDEQLVQLASRLEAVPHRRREPQAIVFSTERRGVAAAICHMLRSTGMPAITLALGELTAHRRSANAIARQFPHARNLVVDAGLAQCEELLYFAAMLQHLHLIGGRFTVVMLGDDDAATTAASLHQMAGLSFVRELTDVMASLGIPVESPLTLRERAVLEYVSEGATNQQTAKALGISIATVKTYLARAQLKLKTCDRASAVATALRRGWI
jgi:DNA-binding CsgD family transcriptional regulator